MSVNNVQIYAETSNNVYHKYLIPEMKQFFFQ